MIKFHRLRIKKKPLRIPIVPAAIALITLRLVAQTKAKEPADKANRNCFLFKTRSKLRLIKSGEHLSEYKPKARVLGLRKDQMPPKDNYVNSIRMRLIARREPHFGLHTRPKTAHPARISFRPSSLSGGLSSREITIKIPLLRTNWINPLAVPAVETPKWRSH